MQRIQEMINLKASKQPINALLQIIQGKIHAQNFVQKRFLLQERILPTRPMMIKNDDT